MLIRTGLWSQPAKSMRVRMRLLGINAVGMLMLMMFVVAMDVIMVERSVLMMIAVAFGQVRPDAAHVCL